jgi:hypothetical protein
LNARLSILTLQCDGVLFNVVNGVVRNDGFTILDHRSDADFFPFNWDLENSGATRSKAGDAEDFSQLPAHLGCGVDGLHRLADFRTNAF